VSLINFPEKIAVVLGANWQFAYLLAAAYPVTLIRHAGGGPTLRTYSEDGTNVPDWHTNRLRVEFWHPGSYIRIRVAAAVEEGDYGEYTDIWTDVFEIDANGDYGADYEFREVWDDGALTDQVIDVNDEAPWPTPTTSNYTYRDGIFYSIQSYNAAEAVGPAEFVLSCPTPYVPIRLDPAEIVWTVHTPTVAAYAAVLPVAIEWTVHEPSPQRGLPAPVPWICRNRRHDRPRKRQVSRILGQPPPRARWQIQGRAAYRVFNAAVFRIYRRTDRAPVPSDMIWTTDAALPHSPAGTFADGIWHVSVSWFNGVLDSGFLPIGPRGESYLLLEVSGGGQVNEAPAGPISWELVTEAGGVVRVRGLYMHDPADDARADDWAITYTVDASTPATDTPDATQTIPAGDWFAWLDYALPAQANGTTVKVRLQTRYGTTYSDNSTVKTATADAAGPAAPAAIESWPGLIPNQP
jgi:hypothetical protein